jgi:hypothetical protein
MSDTAPPPPAPAGPTGLDVAGIRQQIADRTVVGLNLDQEVVGGYASAVRLRLREFEAGIIKRNAWRAPTALAIGLFSTLVTLVATKEFSLFRLSRDSWIAGTGLACLAASACAIVRGVKALFFSQGNDVEDVIKDLRSSTPPQ